MKEEFLFQGTIIYYDTGFYWLQEVLMSSGRIAIVSVVFYIFWETT